MKQQKQQQSPLALALISLDNFSSVNDDYGQVFGDKVLASFAKDLEKNT